MLPAGEARADNWDPRSTYMRGSSAHAQGHAAPTAGGGTAHVTGPQAGPAGAAWPLQATSIIEQVPGQKACSTKPISSPPAPMDTSPPRAAGTPTFIPSAVKALSLSANKTQCGTNRMPSCVGHARVEATGGQQNPLPFGFSLDPMWQGGVTSYSMYCPTHGLRRVGSYASLQRTLREHAACRCEVSWRSYAGSWFATSACMLWKPMLCFPSTPSQQRSM